MASGPEEEDSDYELELGSLLSETSLLSKEHMEEREEVRKLADCAESGLRKTVRAVCRYHYKTTRSTSRKVEEMRRIVLGGVHVEDSEEGGSPSADLFLSDTSQLGREVRRIVQEYKEDHAEIVEGDREGVEDVFRAFGARSLILACDLDKIRYSKGFLVGWKSLDFGVLLALVKLHPALLSIPASKRDRLQSAVAELKLVRNAAAHALGPKVESVAEAREKLVTGLEAIGRLVRPPEDAPDIAEALHHSLSALREAERGGGGERREGDAGGDGEARKEEKRKEDEERWRREVEERVRREEEEVERKRREEEEVERKRREEEIRMKEEEMRRLEKELEWRRAEAEAVQARKKEVLEQEEARIRDREARIRLMEWNAQRRIAEEEEARMVREDDWGSYGRVEVEEEEEEEDDDAASLEWGEVEEAVREELSDGPRVGGYLGGELRERFGEGRMYRFLRSHGRLGSVLSRMGFEDVGSSGMDVVYSLGGDDTWNRAKDMVTELLEEGEQTAGFVGSRLREQLGHSEFQALKGDASLREVLAEMGFRLQDWGWGGDCVVRSEY